MRASVLDPIARALLGDVLDWSDLRTGNMTDPLTK